MDGGSAGASHGQRLQMLELRLGDVVAAFQIEIVRRHPAFTLIAELAMRGCGPRVDVSRDVNETAGIVYAARQGEGKSGVLMLGGGSPKNFMLQTEPQIQEILGLADRGHDYFIQVTDARPDTGGLSGATPAEAVSWGKVDPDKLADSVVVYADSTIAAPLLVAYAVSRVKARRPRRLYDQRDQMVEKLKKDFLAEHEKRTRQTVKAH